METYYITDDKMQLHENLWDKNHIETPERIAAINKILQETSLLSKCKKLHSSKADIEDISLVHSEEYIESIRATTSLSEDDLEEFCSKFDDAYMNKHSWESALLSAGCALTLMKTVLKHRGSNGFAAIRPPGHHASRNTACGFCIFNNIAICAKKARQMGCERVLIVDWDVHAGQGTQYSIEDDNSIKLISIHRFEEGKFWPELPESAATQPYKNTINVPLNQLGYGDAEYASFINFLVLPIVQEWQPDLILVSCGFDAAIGDPEGEMEVSPIGFGYMTSVLASLGIPLCVLLEGGYFIESIAQGARFTVQALVEKDPRKFALDLASPSPSFLQTIFSVISLHRSDYDIFDTWVEALNAYRAENGLKQIENPPSTEYKGNRQILTKYPTRDSYNSMTESMKDLYSKKLAQSVKNFEKHSKSEKAEIRFVISEEKLEVTNGATQISIGITSNSQLSALYYYVLTPLSLTYNVSVNGEAFHAGCALNPSSNVELDEEKAEPKKKRKKGETKQIIMSSTYFITDERMLLHKCEWDDNHLEVPKRLKDITDILAENNTLEKCTVLDPEKAALEDLCLVHSRNYVESIRKTESMNINELEEFSASHEDIYVNQHTWQAAQLSAGCSLALLRNVMRNPGSNGFAAIRPPGHHASYDAPCGFCIFNNVAICAKKARQMGYDRVLIVDWDVHAAQGTQYAIEDDSGIKLISIHRYEEGKFWPELAESATVQPYRNTINVPLNELGYGDSDYAAFINFLVLPIIHEWKPDLILVSCGFDAGIGDTQGRMQVSPGGFGYMTGRLASLGISLCLLLEGGYFIESVAKGALFAIRALQERAPPKIHLDLSLPSASFLNSIFGTISLYSSQFSVFNKWMSFLNSYRKSCGRPCIEQPEDEYKGHRNITFPYQTRGLYHPWNQEKAKTFSDQICSVMSSYDKPLEKPTSALTLKTGELTVTIPDGSLPLVLSCTCALKAAALYFFVVIPLIVTHKVVMDGVEVDNFQLTSDEFVQKLTGTVNHSPANNQNGNDFYLKLQQICDHTGALKTFLLF